MRPGPCVRRAGPCSLVTALLALAALPVQAQSEMASIAFAWRWVPIGGGGAIMTVDVSPHHNNVVLAGCDVGGVLRSEDFGRHWEIRNLGLLSDGDRGVADFVWDPSDPGVVYMGSGACFGQPEGDYGGLWRSEDEGRSWRLVSREVRFSGFGSQRQWGQVLRIDPRDGSLWAGTAWDGLMRSRDDGKTWEKLGLAGRFIVGVELSGAEPGTVYVAAAPTESSEGGVWVTRDGGETWAEVLRGERVRSLAADPRHPGRVYVVLRDKGPVVSEDHGASWRPCVAGIEGYLEKLWGNAVAVNPALPGVVYFSATERAGDLPEWWRWRHPDVFVSRDGAASWAPIISGGLVNGAFSHDAYLAHVDASGWWRGCGWFAFNPMGWGVDERDPRRLYLHDWYGVWASEDGGEHWRQAMDGLATTCVRTVLCHPNREDEAYLGLGDVAFFRTRDGGRSIEYFESSYPSSDCTNLAVETRDGDEVLYSVAGGKLVASKDRGERWTRDLPQPPEGARLGPVALDRFARHCLYCGRWMSPDGGKTWRPLTGLPEDWSGRVVSDPTREGRLYAWNTYEVLVSQDGGETWSDVSEGIPMVHQGKRRIEGLDVAPGSGRVYVASAVYGLLVSDDQGKSWRATLPERYACAVDCGEDGRTVAAAAWTPWYHAQYEPGVFLSRDGGETWSRIDGGLGVTPQVTAIVVDPVVAGRVWIGTHGNAAFVGEATQ